MKTTLVVSFDLDPESAEELSGALEGHGIHRRFDAGAYEVHFRRGEGGLDQLCAQLDELDIAYRVQEQRRFRRRELESATALRLAPLPGTSPELGEHQAACGVCGADSAEHEDLVIETSEVPEAGLTVTAGGDLLVREAVARDLVSMRISGCILRTVRDAWGQPLDVFEVVPINTLPPLQTPPTRMARTGATGCPACGSPTLSLSSMLYYDAPVERFQDVNASMERFQSGPRLRPEVVVSQRLFQLLLDHGAAGLQVEPVVLV